MAETRCSRPPGLPSDQERRFTLGPDGSGAGPLTSSPATGPDAFSLADPPAVTEILDAAGFAGVAFTDVRAPVYYGPDVAAALDWAGGFASTREVLSRLDPAAASSAVRRLRTRLASAPGCESQCAGVRANSRDTDVVGTAIAVSGQKRRRDSQLPF
jgi:hypothetical protein